MPTEKKHDFAVKMLRNNYSDINVTLLLSLVLHGHYRSMLALGGFREKVSQVHLNLTGI